MSKSNVLMKSYISQFLLQVVLIVSGFALTKTIVVTYGSEINGLIVSINQFIAYFSLVEAGIGGAAIYALYAPLANKDKNKTSSIFATARKMYYQSGALLILL